jgi:RNA polymerase sigma factor (sigma-70 family)
MPTRSRRVLDHPTPSGELEPPTDGHLLDRFLACRDAGGLDRAAGEAAFAELVRRHGRMVLGVCRRAARNEADAEDAFQATFLVLVRRGHDLTGRASLGGWLHEVAHRTARKARAAARRRRQKEAAVTPAPDVVPADPPDWLPLLDHVLAALSEKYREPLLLCGLEGRPRREVAGLLGIPEGTLASRLAAAKAMLAARLRRCGLPVAAGAVIGLLGEAAVAAVPRALQETTGRAAAGGPASPGATKLVAEVTRAMYAWKLTTAGLVLAAVLVGSVGLAGLTPTPADRGGSGEPAVRPADPDQVSLKELHERVRQAQEKLHGTWEMHRVVLDGKEQEFQFDYYRFTFAERTVKIEWKLKDDQHTGEQSYTVNPTTNPPQITIYKDNSLLMGLYELNGDTLKIAFHGISELERPRSFDPADKRVAELPLIVWEFKRKKPEQQAAGQPDERVADEMYRTKVTEARKALKGTWVCQKAYSDGRELGEPHLGFVLLFRDNGQVTLRQTMVMTLDIDFGYSVNPLVMPAELTLHHRDLLYMMIYELNGDELKTAMYERAEVERPRGFDVKDNKDRRVTDTKLRVTVWKRKKG